MPTLGVVRKAAVPSEVSSWRARIAAHEPRLVRAFLDWVTRLRGQITENEVLLALATGSTGMFDQVLRAVTFQPVLVPVAVEEAVREFRRIQAGGHTMRLSFDLHDPNFDRAVQQHQARLVREVTGETRRAIANMVQRGYATGHPTRDVAAEIHEAIGLTARQAQAVMNMADAQRRHGVRPDVAADRAIRYARRMRKRRALTIARTETARAQTFGRLASWKQAGDRGLFDYALAEMEWSSSQDDPTEICAVLDGTRVPLGSTWPGGLLPGDAHPNCRCAPVLVIDPNRAGKAKSIPSDLRLR